MHLVVGGEQPVVHVAAVELEAGHGDAEGTLAARQQVFGALQRAVAVKAGERGAIGFVIARVA